MGEETAEFFNHVQKDGLFPPTENDLEYYNDLYEPNFNNPASTDVRTTPQIELNRIKNDNAFQINLNGLSSSAEKDPFTGPKGEAFQNQGSSDYIPHNGSSGEPCIVLESSRSEGSCNDSDMFFNVHTDDNNSEYSDGEIFIYVYIFICI
jgi:hypothetical protein